MDYAVGFRDVNADLKKNPALRQELNDIIDHIRDGRRLPDRYYRAGVDADYDELLATEGVKHLHLGGRNSDVLLYLVEYDEVVLLLQINGHIHFRTNPKGKNLMAGVRVELKRLETMAAIAIAAAAIGAMMLKRGKGDEPE